jgi:hypothetical protein
MGMLPSRHYVSEHAVHPDVIANKPRSSPKEKGRAIWWDKTPRELQSAARWTRAGPAGLVYFK